MEATRLAAFERNVEAGNRVRELMIQDPVLADVFLKGLKDLDTLDEPERFRFGLLMRNIFSEAQGGFIRQLAFDADPAGQEGMGVIIDSVLAHPGARDWVRTSAADWRPEFRKFVEQRAKKFEENAVDQQ